MSGRGFHREGLIFAHRPGLAWWHSHAALPTPALAVAGDGVPVYFSGRDAGGRAHIGRFTFDPAEPAKAVLDPEPVLGLGPLGAFDDAGVTSSYVVSHGGCQYLYYTGWSLGTSVPFYLQVGVAVSEDEGRSFRRLSAAPLLDRCAADPYLSASPCVLLEGGRWRMWYVSGTGWTLMNGQPRHHYHIRYAESRDGLLWERRGVVCIDYQSEAEYAIARPWVIRDGGVYRMWFSCRGERYRLGYAESSDGVVWRRDDEGAGLDGSAAGGDGWDAQMTAYAAVFDLRGQRYLLYNGNGYGQTGIGLAIGR